MTTATYRRFVALGDSFTEGLGDPDPTRPNGCRGWADRVAEVLATRVDGFGYANLAVRGRKLLGVVEEQVEPALALEPDLVTLYAGANDILRPRVDLDALVARYADAVGRLAASGAQVVLFTAFDPGSTRVYRPVRGRFALYNELVREVADDHGTLLVDFWRIRDHRDQRLWDVDRMHMGAPWATTAWPSRCSTSSASSTTWSPRCSPILSRSRAPPGFAPTSPGAATTCCRGCTAGSPDAPPATPSAPATRRTRSRARSSSMLGVVAPGGVVRM